MKISHLFSFALGLILFQTNLYANYEKTNCHLLSGTQKLYCLALKTAENKAACSSLAFDPVAFRLCTSLSQLIEFGTCAPLRDKTCLSIAAGFDKKDCSEHQDKDEFENGCNFGNYLRKEHPEFSNQVRTARIKRGLLPLIKNWMELNITSDSPESKIQSKIIQLTTWLAPLIFKQAPQNRPITVSELVTFSSELVKLIERNKKDLLSTSKMTSPKETKYYRYGTKIGEMSSDDELPCSLAISPEGQIIVFLKSIKIGAERVKLKNLGKGSFKKVSLAVDYEKAISEQSTAQNNTPLLAAGRIILRKLPDGELNLKEINELRNKTQLEFDIHKSISGTNGIARTDSILTHSSKKHGIERQTIVQKFYPQDFFDWIYLDFGDRKLPYFNGKSLDRMRVSMAIDLLEGLAAIHRKGIHHQDIKPENIMIELDRNGMPRLRITDFGAAIDLELMRLGEQVGVLGGTVQFFAPEFLRDIINKKPTAMLNQGNDVWAMGLVLYALNHPTWTGVPRSAMDIYHYRDLPSLEIYDFGSEPPYGTYSHVVYRILNPDQKERITALDALLEMKYVQELEKNKPDPEFYFEPIFPQLRQY